jgi:ketosteroid isomerase-like protein
MSQGNVEIVGRIVDAINQRDAEAWASVVAPEFEFRSAFVGIEGRPYPGPESGRRYFSDLSEAWDAFQLEIENSVDLGDGRVFSSLLARVRGKASGAESKTRIWSINGVRDGKIVSGQTYLDREEALEAAGLRE